ncbi:ester cyclase [Candidatus Fermentibacteria bacterium]|nr:ester cyclase [Candidatus Fermentibacteria bacterium]
MDREALAQITSRWISLWCADPDRREFDALHAEEFVDHSSACRGTTREAFWLGLEELVAAFPDLQAQVEDLVIDETAGRVAVRWSATGTNRVRFMGRGPTHEVVHMTGIEIIEIHDNRITDRWGEWDITDFLGAST